MKIPEKCKGCVYYSNNQGDMSWTEGFLVSHKCQQNFSLSPWMLHMFANIKDSTDHPEPDVFDSDSYYGKVFFAICIITLLIICALPLLMVAIFQGRITKNVLFVCAVKRAYKPAQFRRR